MNKEHCKSCASNKHKYHGDVRNLPWGNEMLGCDCDGYHTFTELYNHRIELFITLCRKVAEEQWLENQNNDHPKSLIKVWRSKVHSNGTSYSEWFIMGHDKRKGEQITYHIPMNRWEDTNFAETLEIAPKFDGHSSEDVIERLKSL